MNGSALHINEGVTLHYGGEEGFSFPAEVLMNNIVVQKVDGGYVAQLQLAVGDFEFDPAEVPDGLKVTFFGREPRQQ